MIWVVGFGIAALLGLIPANIAKNKGYSFGLWWFYGWMLFIVAIIHVMCIKDLNAQKTSNDPCATLNDPSGSHQQNPVQKPQAVLYVAPITVTSDNLEAAKTRVEMYLEDGEWVKADAYCEQILNYDPKNSFAFTGKLLADLKLHKFEDLKAQKTSFYNNKNFERAVRYADDAHRYWLMDCLQQIENNRKQEIYNEAIAKMTEAKSSVDCLAAGKIFSSLVDNTTMESYKDSKERMDDCNRLAVIFQMDSFYNEAKKQMDDDHRNYAGAIQLFSKIPGWKDADELADQCKDIVYNLGLDCMDAGDEKYAKALEQFEKIPGWKDADDLKQSCSEKLEEFKKQKEEERKRKKKKFRKIGFTLGGIALVAAAAVILTVNVFIPNSKYNNAVALKNAGEYQKAINAFAALDGYRDSDERIKECRSEIAHQLEEIIESGNDYKLFIANKTAVDEALDTTCAMLVFDGINTGDEQFDKNIQLYVDGVKDTKQAVEAAESDTAAFEELQATGSLKRTFAVVSLKENGYIDISDMAYQDHLGKKLVFYEQTRASIEEDFRKVLTEQLSDFPLENVISNAPIEHSKLVIDGTKYSFKGKMSFLYDEEYSVGYIANGDINDFGQLDYSFITDEDEVSRLFISPYEKEGE